MKIHLYEHYQLDFSIDLLDLRTLIPLDKEAIKMTVKKTGKVLILHEDSHIGGFVHGGESYMVVNKPNGHSNAQLNTSNNNRYCYGHISIYSSRY